MKKKIGTIYNKPIIIGDKNLKTNNEVHISELTASSGGSGSGGGEASTIEYLDVSSVEDKVAVLKIAQEIRFTNGGGYKIAGPPFADFMSYAYNGIDPLNSTDAIKIDYSSMVRISYSHTSPISLNDFINELGITDLINALPRITKEEFYSLE